MYGGGERGADALGSRQTARGAKSGITPADKRTVPLTRFPAVPPHVPSVRRFAHVRNPTEVELPAGCLDIQPVDEDLKSIPCHFCRLALLTSLGCEDRTSPVRAAPSSWLLDGGQQRTHMLSHRRSERVLRRPQDLGRFVVNAATLNHTNVTSIGKCFIALKFLHRVTH